MTTWRKATLPELADFVNGYAFKPADWGNEGLPIVRIEQLRDPHTVCDRYAGPLPARNIIDRGDLIFSWSASLLIRLWPGGRAALNQHLFKVVPKPGIDKTFLRYLLEYHVDDLANAAHGSTMKHIRRGDIYKYVVEYPEDEDVQRKIAGALLSVDDSIYCTQRLFDKYRRVKYGVKEAALSRGIDETGNVRSLNRAFIDSPLGPIPDNWYVTELSNLKSFITSGSRGWAKYYAEEGSVFLRIGDLSRECVDVDTGNAVHVELPASAEGARTRVQSSDVLISITADLGIIGLLSSADVEAYVNQHIALVRIRTEDANPRYVAHFLSGTRGQKQFAALNESGAKAGLNLPTVEKLLIALPKSLEEQARIVKVIDACQAFVDRNAAAVDKMRRQRRGMLQDIFGRRLPVDKIVLEPA